MRRERVSARETFSVGVLGKPRETPLAWPTVSHSGFHSITVDEGRLDAPSAVGRPPPRLDRLLLSNNPIGAETVPEPVEGVEVPGPSRQAFHTCSARQLPTILAERNLTHLSMTTR